MWCHHPVLSGALCVLAGAALVVGALCAYVALMEARDARHQQERYSGA